MFVCVGTFPQKPDSAKNLNKTKNIDGTMMSPANDIYTNVLAAPQFSILVKLVNAADFANRLKTSPLTFLAPTNKAFEKIPQALLDSILLPSHKTLLISLLNNWLIAEKLTSKDLLASIKAGKGEAKLITASGNSLTASINQNRNILLTDKNGGKAIILKFDIEQQNGMLFVIDAVLLPDLN